MAARRTIRVAVILAGWIGLWALPGPGLGATHYPPGARCYDCHAVSASKMVAGTRLIKSSEKTALLASDPDNPWVPGQPVPCLFCHEGSAVSVPLSQRGDKMRPVDHKFGALGASVLSRHDVAQNSATNSGAATFDCKDCHAASVGTYVVSDGVGNATIHGKDAENEALTVAETLLGSPADTSDAELTAKVCGNAACHGGTGNVYGPYTVKPQHEYDQNITLNDGAAPTGCRSCHDAHGSETGARLFALTNTAVTLPDGTNPVVQLTDCEVCHVQDESAAYPGHDLYAEYGHGKMGIDCDTCHKAGHDVDGDGSFRDEGARLEDNLAEDTAAGTSTFGTLFYSNCKKCHAGHAAHTPTPADGGDPGTGRSAGCVDCHDQHGTAAADATYQNDTMIRRSIGATGQKEDTRLPTGRADPHSYWYDPEGTGASTSGVCDNGSCHTAITTSLKDDHLGGTLTASTCATTAGCHTDHLSSSEGQFGAGSGCDTCHGDGAGSYYPDTATTDPAGWPDRAGSHTKHGAAIGGSGSTPCLYCHAGIHAGDQDAPPADLSQDGTNTTTYFRNMAGAQDTDASYDPAATQCANVDCHAGTTTPNWYTPVVASPCTMCHDSAPSTGAHLAHADTDTNYVECDSCHGDAATTVSAGYTTGGPSGLHNNGTADVYIRGDDGVWNGTNCTNVDCHFNNPTPNWVGGTTTCSSCHAYPPTSGVDHVSHLNLPGDDLANFLAQHDDCMFCHGAKDDGTGNLETHANYPAGSHGDGLIRMNGPTDPGGAGAQYNDTNGGCDNACHPNNADYRMPVSATREVNYGDFGAGSCDACHAGNNPKAPQVLWPAGNASGKDTSYGSHLGVDASENQDGFLSGVVDWNAQCNKCHTFHSGPVQVPLPPSSWDNPGTGATESWDMQARLGLDYATHNGIFLGGTVASGSSEAELCWNCHGAGPSADAVNEWGYNSDTNGSSFPVKDLSPTLPSGAWTGPGSNGSYNYGWIYADSGWSTPTADWTGTDGKGAYRRDAYQHTNANGYMLSKRITSIHSVNFGLGTNPGSSVANNIDGSGNVIRTASTVLESRGEIRCSYCHDVHDLNKADGGAGYADTQSGPPHLRGAWMGNPYPHDAPPLSSYSYPTTGSPAGQTTNKGMRFYTANGGKTFSYPVPRLWADANLCILGGYWIDANSGRPTDDPSYDSLEETAGLCVLCHGTDVDNMDYYPNASTTMWRSGQVNGHSNAVLGGTGSNARNIFNASRYWGEDEKMAHQEGVNWRQYGKQASPKPQSDGPFRSSLNRAARDRADESPPRNTGWYGGTPGSLTRGSQYSTWYNSTTPGTDGVNATAHKFTCSKCHSPHATGLPALLITNCLDVNATTWNPGSADPFARQANNCHRKESTSTGWNKLNIAQ